MSKKVLFVCKAGVRRSATAAKIFSQPPYNFETKAAGVSLFARERVTSEMLDWADEIVCMSTWHVNQIEVQTNKDVYCLKIPDKYEFMSAELIELLEDRYSIKENIEI